MTIQDPRRYVLTAMAEMGLANFFQACAEACAHNAGLISSPDPERELEYAEKWRTFERGCLKLMRDAYALQLQHPFITSKPKETPHDRQPPKRS